MMPTSTTADDVVAELRRIDQEQRGLLDAAQRASQPPREVEERYPPSSRCATLGLRPPRSPARILDHRPGGRHPNQVRIFTPRSDPRTHPRVDTDAHPQPRSGSTISLKSGCGGSTISRGRKQPGPDLFWWWRGGGHGEADAACGGVLRLRWCDADHVSGRGRFPHRRRVEWAIAWSIESQPAVLRLDLTEVGFIESSGLGCLVVAAVSCHRHGVLLQVIASPSVRRLLELSGMAITGDGVIALSPSAEGRTTLVTGVAEGGPR
jgi:anti-anti-sigma regulatory factor